MGLILHILGIDDVSGRWYAFWSGFAGDITLLFAVLAAPFIQWKRNNCQFKGCWRFGRHPFEEGSAVRHLCWLHHPDVQHKQLTRERMHLYIGKRPGRG